MTGRMKRPEFDFLWLPDSITQVCVQVTNLDVGPLV